MRLEIFQNMSKKLGRYLKEARRTHNLTLRRVEEETGISNAYLSQLENNKISRPSPQILHKLANCYQVPYEHLMELAGYPLPTSHIDEERVLLPAFRSKSGFGDLTKEEEKKLLEYLQFLRTRRRSRG